MKIKLSQLRKIISEEIKVVSLKKQPRNLGYGEGEGRMSKSQLFKVARYAQHLHDTLLDDDDLPEWVQSKISVMAHDIGKIKHYLMYYLMNHLYFLIKEIINCLFTIIITMKNL